MLSIKQEVIDLYNLEVFDITPVRDILLLKTDKGLKCFKKVDYSINTLLFIHGGKEHLYSKGFSNIDRFNICEDGKPYVEFDESVYVLTDWIDARECELENPIELKAATEKLAQLHDASKGFINVPEGSKIREDYGKLPLRLEKRCNEFMRMKKMADKRKSLFDFEYLASYEYYYNLAIYSVELIKKSNYNQMAEKAKEEKGFIHRDYSYHNILYTNNKEVYIIDFDYLTYDLRIIDIASFMQKVLKRIHWDIKTGESILKWYNNISTLSKDELYIIFIILMFPYRYWKTCNRYFNGKKSWSEKIYTSKLNEVIAEKDFHRDFIMWYEKNIL
ncbi:CotS family spore coat protein [Caldicellulosiruptoraceae bacterium PP1]